MIRDMYRCCNPEALKDEQPIDTDYKSFFSSLASNTHKNDMMSEMNKKLEVSERMNTSNIGVSPDRDDKESNGQYGTGTLDEEMTQLRVNRDVPLCQTSIESGITLSMTTSQEKLKKSQDQFEEVILTDDEGDQNVAKYRNDIMNTKIEEIDDKTGRNFEELEEDDGITKEDILKDITCEKVNFDEEASPLYRAIDTRSWKTAYKILDETPEEASTWVYRGDKETSEYDWMFLPLHVACFSGAPLDLIKALVRACPQGVRMAANGGKLPLHIACETLAQSSVIIFLHRVYSEAMYIVDDAGNTPLQEAMFCESKLGQTRVMQLLISLTAIGGTNDDNVDALPISKPFKKLRSPVTLRRGARSSLV